MTAVSEREQKILGIIETARAKQAKFRDAHITMAHGAGGKATQGLIEGLLAPAFGSEQLDALGDAGIVSLLGGDVALTTDSFVVHPLRFPGGDAKVDGAGDRRPWPALDGNSASRSAKASASSAPPISFHGATMW